MDGDGTGAARVRSGLRGAALVHVEVADRAPGVVVVGEDGTERRDPRAGRDDVGLDPAVLARSAAGEIRHDLLARIVDAEAEAVVVGRAGGDDVLGHRRAADGLSSGAGVAVAELEHVRLLAGDVRIGVADERVELRGAQVVLARGVVAPRVRSDVCAAADGVLRQLRVARRRMVIARAVEDPLGDDMRTGRDTEAPEVAFVVLLPAGAVACDDSRDVRAVAVLVAGVGKTVVSEESVDAAG